MLQEEDLGFSVDQFAAMRGGAQILSVSLLALLYCSVNGETGLGGAAAAASPLDRHEVQLARLESLVETLSRSVSRLESAVSGAAATLESPPAFGRNHGEIAGGAAAAQAGGITMIKFKPSWPERFEIAAAARLDSEATSATVLPHENHDGLSKYFAVGDARGAAYIFSAAGDFLLKLPAPASLSPVTSMLTYGSARRNESFLFTGHGDGSVFAHRLGESAGAGEEWPTLAVASSRPFPRQGEEGSAAILSLGVYPAGRVKYVVAADGDGKISVFTESGTLYSTAVASSRPLAFSRHRLLFLTETGAGSLDMKTMAVRETECDGLNGTRAVSYAFDVSERSKAYGFTDGGSLVQVVLLGDAASIKCRVRASTKAEMGAAAALQTIRGYLIAATPEKVFVYNVSSSHYGRAGAPRPLFSASLQEIRSLFLGPRGGTAEGTAALPSGKPLIAGDREKLLILGLGGGYVGIYRSNFPVYKAEGSAVLWSSPVLVFLIFLVGIWHFYAKKKKDVLGWTPEEFNQAAFAADAGIMGAVAGADRDRGGGGGAPVIRGPARRYVSPPSRYGGGAAAAPFRPGSADSAFRGGGDLKYRAAQRMEAMGFPKRRDAMAANAQGIVEDHVD